MTLLGSLSKEPICPPEVFSFSMTRSNYGKFNSCTPLVTSTNFPTAFTNVAEYIDCFELCEDLPGPPPFAAYQPQTKECRCGEEHAWDPRVCLGDSVYLYKYGPNVVPPSGAFRRRDAVKKKRRQQAFLKDNIHCPEGYQACRIASNATAEARYECIVPTWDVGECLASTAGL